MTLVLSTQPSFIHNAHTQSLVAMVVHYASRIAERGECLHVSVEEDQARELLVCGVLLTWLLAPVVLGYAVWWSDILMVIDVDTYFMHNIGHFSYCCLCEFSKLISQMC